MLARDGKPILSNWETIDLSLPRGFSTSYYAAALESPLVEIPVNVLPSQLGDMNLCASKQELSILSRAGLDVLSYVNNHKEDCSPGGEVVTEKLLADAGFMTFEEMNQIWVSHIPKSTLAIISIEDVSKPVDENAVAALIKQQKEAGYFVIISAHWGNEYQAGPDEHQTKLAQNWVDAGADVIWGHHPHVLQRIDWLVSSTDGHNALVMYSLGNLLADQFMLADAQRSALIRLDIVNSQIKKVTLLPAMFDWDTRQLKFDLGNETRDKILNRLDFKPNQPIEVDVYSGVN